MIALRDRVHAAADAAIGEASADVTVTCTDGRQFHTFVRHAVGSLERPMSDADLARKFHGLVDPVLGTARADSLIAQCAALSAMRRYPRVRGADARPESRPARCARAFLPAAGVGSLAVGLASPLVARIFRSMAMSCTGRGCGSRART